MHDVDILILSKFSITPREWEWEWKTIKYDRNKEKQIHPSNIGTILFTSWSNLYFHLKKSYDVEAMKNAF